MHSHVPWTALVSIALVACSQHGTESLSSSSSSAVGSPSGPPAGGPIDPMITAAFPDPAVRVVTQHNDSGRTGANLNEHVLLPSSVNGATFGKIGALPVDGQVYAQPLYVAADSVNGTRNVVYVASMHNWVYAYDADTLQLLWQRQLAAPCTVNPWAGYTDIWHGDVGILSTPVIDPATHRLYVVAHTQQTGVYQHLLFALDTRTGADASPHVTIQATVPGTGAGAVGGTIAFDSSHQGQRAALLLTNGQIYIGFASYGDNSPYHGWLLSYDATTLNPVAAFNTTPATDMGGIWMAGQGPATDGQGNVYVSTGNSSGGTLSSATPGQDMGESMLKLDSTLHLLDSYSPANFTALNSADLDLGSAGLVVIPDALIGTSLVFGGGKDGRIFLMGTSAMSSPVQTFQATEPPPTAWGPPSPPWSIFGSPIFAMDPGISSIRSGRMYVWGSGDQLRAFTMKGSRFTPIAPQPLPVTTQLGLGDQSWTDIPGGFLSYAGSGGKGIVWASHSANSGGTSIGSHDPGRLWAFDAATLAKLWSSTDNLARDDLGLWGKFSAPTIANGRVYVATFSGQVAVYGLLSDQAVGPGTIGGPSTLCLDGTSTYVVPTVAGATYAWTATPSSGAPGVSQCQNQPQCTIDALKTWSGVLQVTIRTARTTSAWKRPISIIPYNPLKCGPR